VPTGLGPERAGTFGHLTLLLQARHGVLGIYSYGLYVYHHFITYYLTTNRTDLELARWIGSHSAAVALQAAVGASISLVLAYPGDELVEKRLLRLKQLFGNQGVGAWTLGRGERRRTVVPAHQRWP
jgi:peptidoglycan/LPS O-acetylase OafA/YrhL